MKLNKAQFYLDLEREPTAEQIEALRHLIERRSYREPLAYIVGHKEFFGIDFYVDHRVLIPRPETELLVEQAIELARSRFSNHCLIGDIGTGCGAIAIALALNLPQARVYATDISASALEVAAINCQRHRVDEKVHLLRGNLLTPIPEPLDLIVANLPYVKNQDITELAPEIRLFEPLTALAGGPDGLKWIRTFLSQTQGKLRAKGVILLEIAPEQARAVVNLAKDFLPEAETRIIKDLSERDRALIVDRC